MVGATMRTALSRSSAARYGLLFAAGLIVFAMACFGYRTNAMPKKGYGVTATGLYPVYPSGYKCSPLTSLYASRIDVDGSRRDETHVGVDGGRLGDDILAPADGVVEAVWKANWGWGEEGSLLIRHTREDLNLDSGPPFYYSEFDHLRYEDIAHFQVGEPIGRGEKIGVVHRPGGKARYLPEVHWEVHEVANVKAIKWYAGQYGTQVWANNTSQLIDPLYLLSLNATSRSSKGVEIVPFDETADYSQFRGFTYILPCVREEE
jgi:murein DD-endopeptidase MepM/ murein hydrolase activator NlpD